MPSRSDRKPVIGVICNAHLINDQYPVQAAGEINLSAVAEAAGGLPLMVPAMPGAVDLDALREVCDGFVFTGGRPNVHPSHYGMAETEAHGPFDPARDAVTLPLIRACVAEGRPIFGICRGFQEIAVAFGCTLHPEIRELPGRMNHRMPPEGTLEEKFALRHKVLLSPGGRFERLLGKREVMVNSLHGQGILDVGEGIVVEGRAEDGTIEALAVRDAPGFALAVQWHAEWRAAQDPVSRPLFEAFGEAARAFAAARR
ncbi:gamma-glutamyl-gamma-aminobutyrate hydrolase family protein [Oceanicella actignis]|uniref:gamma-glutamyl-gamma-aminobutyrate hydrolase n=1 Tax=Oceanicella actignis TaxID=1189325 RepID=A0A1M7RYM2_9RHOB|nr:gamma-glutamyl-gamma-aminobutyrate hydrolase family protein [Oceanicella actignis]TYO90039.1 putative glutamine amidotransferase [Oceanicella actignis]SES96103.1 putative glutamine amidotransferase [Oceanicella actignis]SHN51429.1 putative glutamine amidotransferase [Oceanicella actignis]